jgi:hypothetical protein
MAGGICSSFIFSVANGYGDPPDWREVTPEQNPLTIRDSARGFAYGGKVWIAGGYTVGNVPRRDLLSSDDGIHWSVVNPATPFAAYSPITAHEGKIVATYPNFMTSQNGIEWIEEETIGDTPPLSSEKPIVSYNGDLVILSDRGTYIKEGNRWLLVENPFVNHLAFSAVVHDGKLYVVGGAVKIPSQDPERGYQEFTSLNEVWVTDDPGDPAAWKQLVSDAEWRDRMWPGLVSHEGWLYVIGGWVNKIGENTSSVWRSADGSAWERVPTKALPPARHAPTVFSHGGKIILCAGNTNRGTSVQNDIWALNV